MSPSDRERQARQDRDFGLWLKSARTSMKPEKWTQQRVADELGRRGYHVERSWIVQVEGGAHPSEELRDALQALFGRRFEAHDEPGPTDLLTALREQTDAISALVLELRLARERQTVFDEDILRALGALAGSPALQGTPPGSGRAAPVGTPQPPQE